MNMDLTVYIRTCAVGVQMERSDNQKCWLKFLMQLTLQSLETLSEYMVYHEQGKNMSILARKHP